MTRTWRDLAADDHPRRAIRTSGGTISYVDTGAGDPVVFLHGNPTSSYLWRNVIPHVADVSRCLAPDLLGMGWSDKSTTYSYRFEDHARILDEWFDAVGAVERVTLVVHDWGSALGFYRAMRFPEQIAGIVYMEAIVQPRTWAGFGDYADAFRALRGSDGEEMMLGRNAFVEQMLPQAVLRDLSEEEMTRYREPYPTRESRIPTLVWPREIPIEGDGPPDTLAIVERYADWLANSDIPKLLVRGNPGEMLRAGGIELGFCRTWLNQCEVCVPGAHYLQEDSPDEIGLAIREFVGSIRPSVSKA